MLWWASDPRRFWGLTLKPISYRLKGFKTWYYLLSFFVLLYSWNFITIIDFWLLCIIWHLYLSVFDYRFVEVPTRWHMLPNDRDFLNFFYFRIFVRPSQCWMCVLAYWLVPFLSQPQYWKYDLRNCGGVEDWCSTRFIDLCLYYLWPKDMWAVLGVFMHLSQTGDFLCMWAQLTGCRHWYAYRAISECFVQPTWTGCKCRIWRVTQRHVLRWT